ncbi:antibiotic biosynthesis monooxygenase [Actinoplanes hulinensis]|uniref:Antibiotic biosynthesis monooxygenase n=1 Tax=Actinoplanes hulinensis TaxID=1144547 RepID=A0ABS7B7W8_9ACTN|nr:antibiotic biosynthesis monooxygenase [Actinoplanes hulinensis]MBW6437111.1 antibiotic biosynthesis monooxygenase [Actinoplanes hulinensis]
MSEPALEGPDPVSVIVRTSTARVVPGRMAAFTDYILAAVSAFPGENPGLLSHRVLVDDEAGELVYLSRWRDEEALAAFAGPAWRDAPVMLPGEEEYLLAPLLVRHYREAGEWSG